MKVKLRATVTYTWEEDTEAWKEEENPPQTKEQLITLIKDIVKGYANYILEMDFDSIEIQAAE